MKKIAGVIAMLIVSIMTLAGCVDMKAEVNIHNKDAASGVVEVTTDPALLQGASVEEALAQNIDMEQMKEELGDTWSYTIIDTPEMAGLRYETTEEMSLTELQDAFKAFDIIVELGTEGENYTFEMPGTPPTPEGSGVNSAVFSVTFPGKVIEHSENAHVEGSTAEFDLLEGGEEFSATGAPDNTMFYSLIFGGALLLVTFIIVLAFAPKAAKDKH